MGEVLTEVSARRAHINVCANLADTGKERRKYMGRSAPESWDRLIKILNHRGNYLAGPVFRYLNPVYFVSILSPNRQRRANLNMEKVYRENEGKLENKGNVDNEGKPEDEVQSENEGQSTEKEKLEVERKSEREPEVQNERKPDNERQPAGEGKQEKQGKSEAERNPLREGKRESQAKPESQSHAAAKRPAEDYVPRKAKRKTNRTTEDSPTD